MEFTANYSDWPFNGYLSEDHPDYGFEEKIHPSTRKKLVAWAQDFQENFDEETGLFPSQEHRARFDRRYIELANELRDQGLIFPLAMWW